MRRLEELARFAPALVALAVFAPALDGAFVYDDFPAILKNPRVTAGTIAEIFTSGSYWREDEVGYRPMATLSFRAERALFGERAWAFHATNLLLHALNAFLVAALARRVLLGGVAAASLPTSAPLFAALLFAVHPAQAEAVCGIAAGRAELLAALFSLLALGMLLGSARSGGRTNGVGGAGAAGLIGALLYLAALLSKESALVLPAILLALDRPPNRARVLALFAPLAGALAVYLFLRHTALGRLGGFAPAFLDNPLAHAAPGAFVPGVLRVLSEYARLVVWPDALSADYGFDAVPLPTRLASALTPALIPGAAFAAAIAGLALWAIRRRGDARPARAALALAATLVIPLHLVAPLPALCAERFLYMPLAFAALFVAAAVFGGRAGGRALRGRIALFAVILIALTARSAARARDWRSELSLFSSSARAMPGSARSHMALGLAYRNAGRAADAEAEYGRALAIAPRYSAAIVNLGNIVLERGEADSARALYEAALVEDPGYERARWNLAVALERLGDPGAAAREYAALAAADPAHFDARLRLGELLAGAGRPREARRALEEALAIRPGDPAARRALDRLGASTP